MTDEWVADEKAGRPTRFHVEPGWCWRAAEMGLDPTRCVSPRPEVTERAEEILGLLRLCSTQVTVSMVGAVGFLWPSVALIAESRGVDTTGRWWEMAGWWEVFAQAEQVWVSCVNAKKPEGQSE